MEVANNLTNLLYLLIGNIHYCYYDSISFVEKLKNNPQLWLKEMAIIDVILLFTSMQLLNEKLPLKHCDTSSGMVTFKNQLFANLFMERFRLLNKLPKSHEEMKIFLKHLNSFNRKIKFTIHRRQDTHFLMYR